MPAKRSVSPLIKAGHRRIAQRVSQSNEGSLAGRLNPPVETGWVVGTVTAIGNQVVSVDVSGSTLDNIFFSTNYTPVIGDWVYLVSRGADLIALFALIQYSSVLVEPDFLNGWGAGGVETPYYRRVGNHITLYGGVSGGTNEIPAFQVEDGFAPFQNAYLPLLQGGGSFGYVQIDTDGNVIPYMSIATSGGCYLDGIGWDVN